MDPIKLHFDFNEDKFIILNKIRWSLASQDDKLILVTMLPITVVFIITLSIFDNEDKIIFAMQIVSICSLLLTLFSILNYFRSYKKYKYSIKKKSLQLVGKQDKIEYEFSDKSVKYRDSENAFELDWSLFKNYSILGEFLIINPSENLAHSLYIERTDQNEKSFSSILFLTKSKLRERRIKQYWIVK